MGTLPTPLKPFSTPHRPINPTTAPDVLRGNDNQTAKALNEHTQDAGLHTVTTSVAGVTTSAVAIAAVVVGNAYALVSGDTGAGKAFVDQVVWNGTSGTTVAVSSSTTRGAPDARTYTVAAGVLKLTMAAGTYTITVMPVVFTT